MISHLSREGASEGNHEHRETLAHSDAIQKSSIGMWFDHWGKLDEREDKN